MRRAKIVCTMGPAVLAPGMLEALVGAGMDCARLNFSHGAHAEHLATAERVREAGRAVGKPVSLLVDLQGPKIRVGVFADGPIHLLAGSEFVLTGREVPSSRARASVSYPALARDVKPGDMVLLDDGLLALQVTRIEGDDVVCLVQVGGMLSDRKGVNLPGAQLSVPALTDKDRLDLEFAVKEIRADYIALSFVRRAVDLREAKLLATGTPVIAKIEKPEAIDNLLSILDEADGVMVARGDLGVELGSEKVPMAQKRVIREANKRGKLVITATQMLDSMIRNPRPTRAEAADVANAILDGTDAIMLSGETAVGAYPLETVRMMDAITREAEREGAAWRDVRELLGLADEWEFASGAAHAAALLTYTLPLVAIVVATRDGKSAELLSSYRPRAPIYALSADARVAGRLASRWGIEPRVEPVAKDLDSLRALSSRVLQEAGFAVGASYALVLGIPLGERTNTVLLQKIN